MDNPMWQSAILRQVHYKTNYVAHSAAALQSYLADDAPGLRADFMLHCPKDAKVSRRVWSVQQHWDQ